MFIGGPIEPMTPAGWKALGCGALALGVFSVGLALYAFANDAGDLDAAWKVLRTGLAILIVVGGGWLLIRRLLDG